MAIPRSSALRLALAGSLLLTLAACEEETPPPPPPVAPEIGIMDIPISLRHDPRPPANALTISISQDSIGIGENHVMDLERGVVPEGERGADGVIPSLNAAIQTAPASAAAIIKTAALVPYGTVARVAATLEHARIRTLAFAVRTNNATESEFMEFGQFATRVRSEAPYQFDPTYQRSWDEFVRLWDEMRTACQGPHAGDCLQRLTTPPTGGYAQLGLFARGQALLFSVQRFTDDELAGLTEAAPVAEEEPAGDDDTDISNEELMRLDPQKSASFMWRFPAATMAEGSPITATIAPLCQSQGCGFVITAEEPTPVMKILTFIGAAFPNGRAAPALLLEVPER